MTSKKTGSSEHALIDLIYRHLKENGYTRAASALKQHAPQVQATDVTVSLNDIFKKWVSEERGKNDDVNDPQTGSVSTTNVAQNTRSAKKTRKRSETKTRKISSVTEDHKTGEDSDSDSSLDVEKWKSLALQLSDADIAKMDAFTNFTTSTAKSTKKRKPAQPKKQPLPKVKTKAKTATTPTKTDKKPTDKKTLSICQSDKIKAPSNKAIITEPEVKSPESKTVTSLSDQVVTPKTAVSNGLSESDRTKVKGKKKHSLSKSLTMETPGKKAETGKTDNITEPKPTDTECKKTKSKKNVKVTTTVSLESPSRVADPQTSQCGLDSVEMSEPHSPKHVLHSKTCETKAKKDKSKKAKIVEPVGIETSIHTYTEDATSSPTSDQSKINQVLDFNPTETPSKKAKSKKTRERQEPGDVSMPSGECEIKIGSSHFNKHQTESPSASVKQAKSVGSEPVEKQSKKAKKRLLESNGTEEKIGSQAGTSILESLSTDAPSKKSKTKKATEAEQADSPSKDAVVDVWESEHETKSSSSKSHHTENSLKKSKRKISNSFGGNVTSSVTEHEYDSLIPAANSAENEGQESVLALEMEGTPEPKKRKKNKKDKEKKKNEIDEHVEEVPPTPPAEEFSDSLTSSRKKKKKKKQKHREEEVLPVSDPAPDEDSPKKKKKSSKKKEHADMSEEGLL